MLTGSAHYNAYPMHADNVPHKVMLLLNKIKTTNETPKEGADKTDAAEGVPAAAERVDAARQVPAAAERVDAAPEVPAAAKHVPAEGAHKTAAAAAKAAEAIWLQKHPEPDRASVKFAGDDGEKLYQRHLVKWQQDCYQVCYMPTVRCNSTLA